MTTYFSSRSTLRYTFLALSVPSILCATEKNVAIQHTIEPMPSLNYPADIVLSKEKKNLPDPLISHVVRHWTRTAPLKKPMPRDLYKLIDVYTTPPSYAIEESLERFYTNLERYKIQGGEWYQKNIPKDLEGLQAAYPLIRYPDYRDEAAAIAEGLATLPAYEEDPFYIKRNLWWCRLIQLQQAVGLVAAKQLTVTLEDEWDFITLEVEYTCWYHGPKKQAVRPIADEDAEKESDALPPQMPNYLQRFEQGLKQYDVRANRDYYIRNTKKQLQQLQTICRRVDDPVLLNELVSIADSLSTSYRFKRFDMLTNHLTCQYRLLESISSIEGIVDTVYPLTTLSNQYHSWKHGSNQYSPHQITTISDR